jgi:hypothetical protein
MRDADVFQREAQTQKRVAMIYRQMVFLDCRVQAFEKVLTEPWALLKAIFNPLAALRRVNNFQIELMKRHDQELTEAVQERKAKPNLVIARPNGVFTNGR